jgi:hypothetical protein
MGLKTFSFILKDRYHIQLDRDSFIDNVKFSKAHKKVLQELFKRVVRALSPLKDNHFKIVVPKTFQHKNHMEIEIFYEESTKTFHIKNTFLYGECTDINAIKNDQKILWDDFCFDEKANKLIWQEEQRKYAKLLKRVLKKRKSVLRWAHFSDHRNAASLDATASLSPANILTKSVRKKREKKQIEGMQEASAKIKYVLKISYAKQAYEIIKTKHLYHKRNGKPRIEGFSDTVLKKILLSALKQGEVLQYQRAVLVFPKDQEKTNYYSMLIDFNKKKNRFVIITIFADDTQYRKLFHFSKEKHAIYLEDISFDECL